MRIRTRHAHSGATVPLRRPPGPGLAKMAMIAARLSNPTYTLLPEIARRYGDVAAIPSPVPGLRLTLVSHPDLVDHVMTRRHARYLKHDSTREWFFDEPMPMPLLEGDEWRQTRRTLNPHFGTQSLASVGDQMVAGLTERVDAWAEHVDSGRVVELQHELGVMVMDGLMRSMFSIALPTRQLKRFAEATERYDLYVMVRAATYLLPEFVPRPFRASGDAAKRVILSQLDDLISQRRRDGPRQPTDVLDVLLDMPFEGTPQTQYARLRAELLSLVLAGVGTTTAALGWAVALLYAHPNCLARAYAEVDALDGETPAYEHLSQLDYLRCCFDESQRIQSATPAHIRTAAEDDEIGGYFVPAGSYVAFAPYGLHRDPRFWTDPDEYRPSRFSDDKVNRNAFVPFNVGPRKCMGYRLAYAEAVLALAVILQRYHLTLRTGWRPRHEFRAATGLTGGLPVTLSRRSDARPAGRLV